MSLSARRSCTIPKPKPSSSNNLDPAVFKPSHDTQYIKKFLTFWNQGKSDRKASQAFVKLHSTCERHACKAKPRSCVAYKDGISCTTCQNMGMKCPRLQAFLLDYVAVHLGISSKTAQDLYGRYVRKRPEPSKYGNAGKNGEVARGTNGKGSVAAAQHDEMDSSDWDSGENFTEELLSDGPVASEVSGDDWGDSEGKRENKITKQLKGNTAGAVFERLSALKEREDELEAEVAKTRMENAALLERQKQHILNAIAAEHRPPPAPSPEVLERALEAELLKRRDDYRAELLEEWSRLHDRREPGRSSEQRTAYNNNAVTPAYIMVPSGSVALHAAIDGFVEALGLDEATSRVLDLLQWVTELSNAVNETKM